MTTRSKITKGEDELHTTIKNIVTNLCKSDFFITEISNAIMKSVEEKYNKEIETLRKENNDLKLRLEMHSKEIKSLRDNQELHDQFRRSKNIIFYGIEEVENENCVEVILKTVANKMNIDIDRSSIDHCFRLKSMDIHSNKGIMVQLSTVYLRNTIFASKKLLKGTGIVVREDLTTEKLKLLKTAIKKVNKNGKVWTNKGNIFVKYNDRNAIMKITTKEDLDK